MKDQRTFVISIWLLAVVVPVLVLIGELSLGRLLLNPDAVKLMNQEIGTRVVRLVIAGLPYVILGLFTQSKLKKHPFETIYRKLIGSMVAVFASSVVIWWAYFNDFDKGGGANFGIIFLLLFSPLYIPVFMLLGYYFATLSPHE
jgi:hypothetical protein